MSITSHIFEFQHELSRAPTFSAIRYNIVNHIKKITNSEQCYLSEGTGDSKSQLTAISDVLTVELNSPQVLIIDRLFKQLSVKSEFSTDSILNVELLKAYSKDFPPFFAYVPLSYMNKGQIIIGGLLLFRYRAFTKAEITILNLLADASTQAMLAFWGRKRHSRRNKFSPKMIAIVIIFALLPISLLIKVPLNIVAPFEVIPKDAQVVSAPYTGVIEKILVKPGQTVKPGDLLVEYDVSELSREAENMAASVALDRARLSTILTQGANDPKQRSELPVLQARLELTQSNLELAKVKLSNAVIKSNIHGIVILDRPSSWMRKPVQAGEEILTVIKPEETKIRVEVSSKDVIELDQTKPLKLSYDQNPLGLEYARISHVEFEPFVNVKGVLSYAVYADRQSQLTYTARVGERGTARVFGDPVTLLYQLLRKPILSVKKMGLI